MESSVQSSLLTMPVVLWGWNSTLMDFPKETKVSLQDIERVFRVGDTVRVIAGSYTGLEGYLIQMCSDLFHVCQEISKEVVSFW
jgi:hypothetical protein